MSKPPPDPRIQTQPKAPATAPAEHSAPPAQAHGGTPANAATAEPPTPAFPQKTPAPTARTSEPISVLIPGEVKPLMMTPQAESPLLGKLVLFTPAADGETQHGAREYVAIIGQVLEHDEGAAPYCNLLVMPPFIDTRWEGSVREGEGPRTWRWPAAAQQERAK